MLALLIGLIFLSSCSQKVSLAQSFSPPVQDIPIAQPQPSATQIASNDTAGLDPSLLAGETLAQQRELFRQGYRLYLEKKRDSARVVFQRALEVYPQLADYSLYYLATLNRDDGQVAEARTLLQRLLTEQSDSIWVGHAALELARFALTENNWTEAVQYAGQARSSRVTPAPVRQEAALVLAQAREGQGESADAYNLYQELRRIAPRTPVGRTAKERVTRLRASDPVRFGFTTDQEYLAEIHLLTQESDGKEVEDLARQFSTRFPTSPLRPESLSLLAQLYKRQGRVDEAISSWKEITESYATSSYAPTALYDWATLLWNKDQDEEAHSVFERLTKQYARQEKAAEAWYAIGRIWQEKKDDTRAAAAYERLAVLFPGTQLAREGRWRQGWMAYQRGAFKKAEQSFAALAKSASDTSEGESAFYWQARAAERQSAREKAVQGYRELLRRYPDGYYALWAEKRLQLSPPPLKVGAEKSGTLPALTPRLESHYRRSQELSAIGLPVLARRELDIVKDGVPRDMASSLFLLGEYSRLEGYAVAFRFARELAKEGNVNWLRYLFPHAYWGTVSAQAQTKGLDPYLVLALIRQESLFDPEAISPAQAYGLMQLLPKTAARVTHTASVSPISLVDPEFNISAGTTYLRQLLDLYNGNQMMAVAAYNAGENAVEKWRTRYAALEPDEFVESISYRETRNYVKLVLRNYRTYRRLYGSKGIGNEEKEAGVL